MTAYSNAQWSDDPSSPQLLGDGIQPQLAPTSDGGVYIAWITEGSYHVYIQRINSLGIAQFDSGLLVSDNENASWIAVYHLNLSVDGNDNAIISTLDQRTGTWEVYVWKISPNGTMLWGNDGLAITNSSTNNMSPRLTVAPDNSIIVNCSHNDNTVFFQRISPDGDFLWGNGIVVEDDNKVLISPQSIIDADGNLIFQWMRQSSGWPISSEIFTQKFNLNGDPIWTEPSLITGPTFFPMGNWSQKLLASSNGGAFIAWTELSGNVQNAIVEKISGEGTSLWGGGIDLSTNSNNFRISPVIALAEETHELIAFWREANSSQSQRGIFAQRLDTSGDHLWGDTGSSVVALNSNYDYLDLSTVEFGEEVISAYIQQSPNMSGDIFAHRINSEGQSVWIDEMVVVTDSGLPKSDMTMSRGINCFFIAWSENGSIYAHCLREDGALGAPDLGSIDCIAEDGTEGVELWEVCYSIANTTTINLFYDELADTIPAKISNLINLSSLVLIGNQLNGIIPSEIGELTNLTELKLEGNYLSGVIPNEIGNLTNLESLSLSSNNLMGEIPLEICNLVNLHGYVDSAMLGSVLIHGLNLSNNSLSGEIPNSIGNLTNLISIDLSNNQLEGEIPSELFSLSNLESINLSNNQLIGEIHPDISNLLNLTGIITASHMSMTTYPALDLSTNYFSGIIPEVLCSLPIDWENNSYGEPEILLHENQFCLPYPSCTNDSIIGIQDTANCESIMSSKSSISSTFTLYSAFPNPFNPITTLKYYLHKDSFVNLTIYDMLGNVVIDLIKKNERAGLKTVQWQGNNYKGETVSAGVYLYRIEAENFRQSKKVILLK